jgi:hypothetical protein
MSISDLQAGKAGEYLVCADLILQGFVAFPSEQGLPFDVVAEVGGRLVKIQVKTTRQAVSMPQRKQHTPSYLFHVKRSGKCGVKRYKTEDVDIFALVALDTRTIGYVAASEAKTTMQFRVKEAQGLYRGDDTDAKRERALQLLSDGLSCRAAAKIMDMSPSNVSRLANSQNASQPIGRYLNDYDFQSAVG